MRRVILSALVLLASFGFATAQNAPESSQSGRKVVSRVAPVCPELAKRMHIQGVVKLEAIVKPNGSVRTTRVLGGNPVLVEAATEAVTKWKFEPAADETMELVQLVFVAQ